MGYLKGSSIWMSYSRARKRADRTALRNAVFGVLALPILLASCEGGRGSDRTGLRWSLTALDSVGGLNGPVDLTYVRAALARSDSLWLIDGLPFGRVIGLDLGSGSVEEVGRQGEGPGEYSSPQALQFIRDTLWIIDPRGSRAEGFVSNTPAASVRMAVTGYDSQSMLSDGSLLLVSPIPSVPDIASGRATQRVWVRASRPGAVLDTVVIQPLSANDYWERGIVPLQESPIVLAAQDGSGIAVVERWTPQTTEAAAYSVALLDVDGTPRRSVRIEYEPVAVDESAVLSRLPANLSAEGVAAVREALRSFPYTPPVTSARFPDGRHVWIRREDFGADEVEWNVVDVEAAELVGSVWLPPGADVVYAAGDWLIVIQPDSLDVPRVIRYRIGR